MNDEKMHDNHGDTVGTHRSTAHKSHAVSDVNSEGLATTALPNAIAADNLKESK